MALTSYIINVDILPEKLSGDDDLWFQFCFWYDTKWFHFHSALSHTLFCYKRLLLPKCRKYKGYQLCDSDKESLGVNPFYTNYDRCGSYPFYTNYDRCRSSPLYPNYDFCRSWQRSFKLVRGWIPRKCYPSPPKINVHYLPKCLQCWRWYYPSFQNLSAFCCNHDVTCFGSHFVLATNVL